jgi:hypothetical protein
MEEKEERCPHDPAWSIADNFKKSPAKFSRSFKKVHKG